MGSMSSPALQGPGRQVSWEAGELGDNSAGGKPRGAVKNHPLHLRGREETDTEDKEVASPWSLNAIAQSSVPEINLLLLHPLQN